MQDFLRLIDAAREACEKAKREAIVTGQTWMAEDASAALAQFDKLAEQVRTNTLPSAQGGGLGITRALSEWAPTYLYSAGEAVEDFYMHKW